MSSSDSGSSSGGPLQPVMAQYTKYSRQYQQVLDKITPFVLYRWLGFAGILGLFMLRILLAQGVSFSSSLYRCKNAELNGTDVSISSGISVSDYQWIYHSYEKAYVWDLRLSCIRYFQYAVRHFHHLLSRTLN